MADLNIKDMTPAQLDDLEREIKEARKPKRKFYKGQIAYTSYDGIRPEPEFVNNIHAFDLPMLERMLLRFCSGHNTGYEKTFLNNYLKEEFEG